MKAVHKSQGRAACRADWSQRVTKWIAALGVVVALTPMSFAQPVVLIDFVAFNEVVKLQKGPRRHVLRHLEARRAHDVRRIGMRAQDTGAIGAGRIDHDTDLDVGILTLELRNHLRLRGGPRISGVVRVEERVVGDFDRLRERDGG